MPDDNADLASIAVEFDRLTPDTAESSPLSSTEILRYLADEVPGGEGLSAHDLRFVRSAQIADRSYWIWSFREPDGGSSAYVTVALGQGDQTTLGYETNYYDLSPEQFLLGDYHDVF